MYKILYDLLMKDLMDGGITKTVIISEDYYGQLSENEVHYLSGLMEVSSRFRWVIRTDTTKHIAFIYSQYPYRKDKNEDTTTI